MPTKYPIQPKCSATSSGDLETTGTFKAPADDLGDVSNRHALFGNAVIPGARGTVLQRQPEEMGSIEPVHRGPAVGWKIYGRSQCRESPKGQNRWWRGS
jgi:hypothetical protein